MTSLADQPQLAGTATAAEPGSAGPTLHRVRVAVVAGEAQIGVVMDAGAPLARQLGALVDVINTRLDGIGQPRLAVPLDSGGRPKRGRWALFLVDGTPLRPGRSLAEQGVVDGKQLWLRYADDTQGRMRVIEHVTSAVPAVLAARWKRADALWSARVGAVLFVVAVAATLAVLARWRYGHTGLAVTAVAGGIAISTVVAATVVWVRHRGERTEVADMLMLCGCVAAALAGAAAVGGPVGAPHAAVAAAVLAGAAVLVARFTGRHLGLCTTVVLVCSAVLAAGLLRALWVTSGLVLAGSVLLVAVLVMQSGPMIARLCAKLRLPTMSWDTLPSGRWIFETRPDLPSGVVVASGQDPQLEGPESVRDVAVAAVRERNYLSGVLTGCAVLLVVCGAGLADPHSHSRWLTLTVAALTAGYLLMHSRSFDDRWQAVILVAAAAAVVIVVALRYALVLWTLPAVLGCCAVLILIPAAGLIAAVVVPNREFSEAVKIAVESIEYVCMVGVFPMTFWLLGVFSAIRHR